MAFPRANDCPVAASHCLSPVIRRSRSPCLRAERIPPLARCRPAASSPGYLAAQHRTGRSSTRAHAPGSPETGTASRARPTVSPPASLPLTGGRQYHATCCPQRSRTTRSARRRRRRSRRRTHVYAWKRAFQSKTASFPEGEVGKGAKSVKMRRYGIVMCVGRSRSSTVRSNPSVLHETLKFAQHIRHDASKWVYTRS
ncbi:hypothetical protein EDD25_1067 [Cryobacterium psychrophilum]|nr:hypothetical protein EDD25_1067 [Cryobacterium psychrophilum]